MGGSFMKLIPNSENLWRIEDSVVFGAHQVSIAEKEQQIFGIMETFPHCQFDGPPFDNDIMICKLKDIAKLNKYVQLLPLPDSFEDVEPGTLCQVAGWGDTSPGKAIEISPEGNP